MKATFSEFSYGFALAFEIMNALRPTIVGAPIFPSLQQEALLGYDVNFTPAGWPLFLQFKLADYMTRRAKYWPYYQRPFYRVAVHQRRVSIQHNLLKELAVNEQEVYYVAPAFRRQEEFNRLFVDQAIFTRTVFIPLQILPSLTDDNQHYITYASSSPSGVRWHSDGESFIDHVIEGKAWLEHLRYLMATPRPLGMPFLFTLHTTLMTIVNKYTPQPSLFETDIQYRQKDDPVTVLKEVQELLATHFGVILIILQKL